MFVHQASALMRYQTGGLTVKLEISNLTSGLDVPGGTATTVKHLVSLSARLVVNSIAVVLPALSLLRSSIFKSKAPQVLWRMKTYEGKTVAHHGCLNDR